VETKRIEAFSDGVFAVAITLLVLNLQPPAHTNDHLWRALLHEWPSYAAFVVSFFVIGIIWVNHHGVFRNIARADRMLLFINLLLLFFVVLLPFCTALLADNLRRNVNNIDSQIAAAIYSCNMLAMSLAFQGLWRWAVKDGRFLHQHIDPMQARAASKRFGFGIVVYAGTVVIAFLSAPICLLVHFLIAMYYVFDQLPVGSRRVAGDSP
jgi:uncharacterized membrane protein